MGPHTMSMLQSNSLRLHNHARHPSPLYVQAKDGICDDGRYFANMTAGKEASVVCDLGTDCSDCGPWKGVKHSSNW